MQDGVLGVMRHRLWFLQVNADLVLIQVPRHVTTGPSTPRTLQQATTCLGLANPQKLSQSGCGTGFGSLSTTKISLGCHRPSAAVSFSGLWGGAGLSGAGSASGNAVLGEWGGIPGQQSRVLWVMYHQLCKRRERWMPKVSPRWCTHVDSTRPI